MTSFVITKKQNLHWFDSYNGKYRTIQDYKRAECLTAKRKFLATINNSVTIKLGIAFCKINPYQSNYDISFTWTNAHSF